MHKLPYVIKLLAVPIFINLSLTEIQKISEIKVSDQLSSVLFNFPNDVLRLHY